MQDDTTQASFSADARQTAGSFHRSRVWSPPSEAFSAGFTLAELLVVIALGGILTGLAVLGFSQLLPKYRLDGATATVRSDLYNAKIRAANHKRQYRVKFNADGYSILQGDKSSGSTVWTVIRSRVIASEYEGVTIDTGSTSNPTFQPRGTATNNTIVVQNAQGGTRTITVTLAGRVKVK